MPPDGIRARNPSKRSAAGIGKYVITGGYPLTPLTKT
jgi:hypothetical protein